MPAAAAAQAAAKAAAAAVPTAQQHAAATTLQSHWRRQLAQRRAAYMRQHRDQIALALGFLQVWFRIFILLIIFIII